MANRYLKMRIEQLQVIDEQEVGQWAMNELPDEDASRFAKFTNQEFDEFFRHYHAALSDAAGGVS